MAPPTLPASPALLLKVLQPRQCSIDFEGPLDPTHHRAMCKLLSLPAGGGLVAKSCPTLPTPWTVAHQGSSLHRIFQARILEKVAISFSRGTSGLRNQT